MPIEHHRTISPCANLQQSLKWDHLTKAPPQGTNNVRISVAPNELLRRECRAVVTHIAFAAEAWLFNRRSADSMPYLGPVHTKYCSLPIPKPGYRPIERFLTSTPYRVAMTYRRLSQQSSGDKASSFTRRAGMPIGFAAAGCQPCTGSLENKTMPFIFVMYLHVACLCAMCP